MKKTVLFGLLGILVAGSVGVAILARQNRSDYSDRNDFIQAKLSVDALLADIINRESLVIIDSQSVENCYMAEQSPYDEGKLWCRVGSAAYFDTKIDDKALYTTAQEAITNHSLAPSFERNAQLGFYGAEQLPCQVNIYQGKDAKSPIHGFGGNDAAETSLLVFCSNRTKEAYYNIQ